MPKKTCVPKYQLDLCRVAFRCNGQISVHSTNYTMHVSHIIRQ